MVPFNVPCITGEEINCIQHALQSNWLAGNGSFTQRCQSVVKEKFGFENAFFTPSGSTALEMAAMLCNFTPGDEVIMPSFTHVSTANAFVRAGAVVKFADCLPGHPNIDPLSARALVGPRSRAIVVVHYGGTGCDPFQFRQMADDHGLLLIEDAAHAIGARYDGQWLGLQGDLAAFSFHETKNIHCGQGGMLVVNRPSMVTAAGEIWQHGTNRARFEKGELPFYTWVRPGGAFLLPELNAAFLYPQLDKAGEINSRRLGLWTQYYEALQPMEKQGKFSVPRLSAAAGHNGHIFYLLCDNGGLRDNLISYLKEKNIQAVFHYAALHTSPYGVTAFPGACCPNAGRMSACLLRLPLYDSLANETVARITAAIHHWTTL